MNELVNNWKPENQFWFLAWFGFCALFPCKAMGIVTLTLSHKILGKFKGDFEVVDGTVLGLKWSQCSSISPLFSLSRCEAWDPWTLQCNASNIGNFLPGGSTVRMLVNLYI